MNCRVMGIVNVTPDSFSDGGKFFKSEEAVRRALNLAGDGAAIIDVGGESTRPGASPIGWDEEWGRLEPVMDSLVPELARRGMSPILSVDTYHPETAERAIAAGARIVNCVLAEHVADMLKVVAPRDGVELVAPSACRNLFVGKIGIDRVYLDPMVGFGTTREEDLEILRTIRALAENGRVLVGASRKRIVKKLTGEKVPGKDLAGNLTIAVWAALQGASVVRVHDVRETIQALKVLGALV